MIRNWVNSKYNEKISILDEYFLNFILERPFYRINLWCNYFFSCKSYDFF